MLSNFVGVFYQEMNPVSCILSLINSRDTSFRVVRAPNLRTARCIVHVIIQYIRRCPVYEARKIIGDNLPRHLFEGVAPALAIGP